VEARLYAEDPERDFLPSTGRLWALDFPEGDGIRVDTGVEAGDDVTPFYDPMIAKVIAWGEDRPAALARLDEQGIPFVSILTDPTTGGVTASFAMLGDLNIAEPRALIGFAGPRVIEQTIRQKLPAGFQRSEFLIEHGMLDLVLERGQMRDTLISALGFMIGARHPSERSVPAVTSAESPR